MAFQPVTIIDFGKALQFFESIFNHLDQKEIKAIDLKLIRLSLQRLQYTADQIDQTCGELLAQIEALEIKREAEADHQALVGRIKTEFQAPARRDTEEDIDDTEALANGTNEEIEPYAQAHPSTVEAIKAINRRWENEGGPERISESEKTNSRFAQEKLAEHQSQAVEEGDHAKRGFFPEEKKS